MSHDDLRELAQELAVALDGITAVIQVSKCSLALNDDASLLLCEGKLCPACATRHLAETLCKSSCETAAALGHELLLAPRARCEGGVHA